MTLDWKEGENIIRILCSVSNRGYISTLRSTKIIINDKNIASMSVEGDVSIHIAGDEIDHPLEYYNKPFVFNPHAFIELLFGLANV